MEKVIGPEFRVGKNTDVNKLSSAIFTNMKNVEKLELKLIGAGALNQAIKSIAAARGISGSCGFDLVIRPSFQEISIQSEEKTAINLTIIKVPCGTI